MEVIRSHLRRFSIAAFVAMFALALAPSVSRAVAASAGFDPLAEICSGSGGVAGALAPSGGGDHCPLCAPPALLPPAVPDVAADAPAARQALPAPRSLPNALRRWSHAPPRAPPTRLV